MPPNQERDPMEALLLVPLDDSIVFPGMTVTLALDLGEERRVLLVPRTNGEFASVGTVAEIADSIQLPGGVRAVTVEGTVRATPGAAHTDASGDLRVEVTPHEDEHVRGDRVRGLEREYRAVVEEILELRDADARVRAFVRSITEPGALADTSGYSPDISLEEKIRLLETLDVV